MILVAGSANLDFVVRAPRIPIAGETVLGYDLRTYPGGKGANQAVACARAGNAETEMLLAVGEDAFAEPIEASLHEAGVRTHIVRTRDRPTGTAFICVSAAAQNAITVAPGGCCSRRVFRRRQRGVGTIVFGATGKHQHPDTQEHAIDSPSRIKHG